MICWEKTQDDSLFSFLFLLLNLTLLITIIIKKFYQQMTYYFGSHSTKIFEFISDYQNLSQIFYINVFKYFTTGLFFNRFFHHFYVSIKN